MTLVEYHQGIRYLSKRYPEFNMDKGILEAWYEDLEELPFALWFVCLKLIVREEDQWWTKNLVALVHNRVPAAKKIIGEQLDAKREEGERLALGDRMSEAEFKTGMAKVWDVIGGKTMDEEIDDE